MNCRRLNFLINIHNLHQFVFFCLYYIIDSFPIRKVYICAKQKLLLVKFVSYNVPTSDTSRTHAWSSILHVAFCTNIGARLVVIIYLFMARSCGLVVR